MVSTLAPLVPKVALEVVEVVVSTLVSSIPEVALELQVDSVATVALTLNLSFLKIALDLQVGLAGVEVLVAEAWYTLVGQAY